MTYSTEPEKNMANVTVLLNTMTTPYTLFQSTYLTVFLAYFIHYFAGMHMYYMCKAMIK